MEDKNTTIDKRRRMFMRKAVYIAPAVLTLSAMPFTASYGSQQVSGATPWNRSYKKSDKWDKWDKSKWDKWDKSDKWDK